jgi:hypothetical protein
MVTTGRDVTCTCCLFADPLDTIRQLYKPLSEKLLAKKVAADMFQRDALSFRELESIQFIKNPYKAAEKLLSYLLTLQEETMSVFECFLEALKSTNQEHIFLWISYPGNWHVLSNFSGPNQGRHQSWARGLSPSNKFRSSPGWEGTKGYSSTKFLILAPPLDSIRQITQI